MSTNVVSEEWRVQALRDPDVSKHLAAGGYHEWASYASQSAAEKAIKAVRYSFLRGSTGRRCVCCKTG
jgi:HEPN domain-containing protein